MRTIRAVYDSMSQCESETGIPLKVLKQAKRAGCPAFKSQRFDIKELLTWLFTERGGGEEDVANWGEELRRQQARRQKILADRAEGKVVDIEWVIDVMSRVAAGVKAEGQRFENEGPSQLAGLSVAEARQVIKKFEDARNREWQRLADEFTEKAAS